MSTNPALTALQPLAGQWRMELYNAKFLPDRNARVTVPIEIEWIEQGAALVIRQGDLAHPPAAVWIIGRDEREPEYSVYYFDDHGGSRIYRMSFEDSQWLMWRDTGDYIQRFNAQLDPGMQKIRGRWEDSSDQGRTWKDDFNIDYIREQTSNPSDS
jgi:hypothetical protein